MGYTTNFRTGLKSILLVCFIVSIVVAISNLFGQDTTLSINHDFQAGMPVPSVTFCPRFSTPELSGILPNMSLEDVLVSNSTQFSFADFYPTIHVEYSGSTHGVMSRLDGLNYTYLRPKSSVTVQGGVLSKCFTFDPPEKYLDTRMVLVIFIKFCPIFLWAG